MSFLVEGLPRGKVGNTHRLLQGCSSEILVSRRILKTKCHYFLSVDKVPLGVALGAFL